MHRERYSQLDKQKVNDVFVNSGDQFPVRIFDFLKDQAMDSVRRVLYNLRPVALQQVAYTE